MSQDPQDKQKLEDKLRQLRNELGFEEGLPNQELDPFTKIRDFLVNEGKNPERMARAKKIEGLQQAVREVQAAIDKMDPGAAMRRKAPKDVVEGPTKSQPAPIVQEALRPGKAEETAPQELMDREGYRSAMSVAQPPAPSQDVQPEFVQDSPDVPTYQAGQDERLSPTVNAARSSLQAGKAERLAVGTPRSQKQIDSTLKELEGLTSVNIREIREREERVNFTQRYGQEPDAIRWTPDGEPVATMSGANFNSLMNRLKMRQAVESVESSRAEREGTDPASIARNRAREQQDQALRMRQQELEADERKTAAKEWATKQKEEEAYALDAAGVIPRAMSDQGSAATKAFARYVDAADSGQPTSGFEDTELQLAEQGATELINLYEGVGRGGLGAAGDTTQAERRNVKQFIGKYLPKLQADRKASSDRRQRREVNSVSSASTPGGMPELPGPTDTRSAVPMMEQAAMGNLLQNPAAGNTNPVGPGWFHSGKELLSQGQMGPSFATSQLGALPTTNQALRSLQDILARNTPAAKMVTSLLAGRGSEAQRNAAMQWITSNYGIDPNQLILRTSIHSDPVWMEQTRKAIQSMQATGANFK